MPVYRIRCDNCGKETDIYRTVAQFDDLPDCHGQKMHRIIGAPFVIAEIKPYRSMVTGQMIESRSQHREHLKRHNLEEIGNEVDAHLKQAGKRRKPRIDKKCRKAQIAEIVNSKL